MTAVSCPSSQSPIGAAHGASPLAAAGAGQGGGSEQKHNCPKILGAAIEYFEFFNAIIIGLPNANFRDVGVVTATPIYIKCIVSSLRRSTCVALGSNLVFFRHGLG